MELLCAGKSNSAIGRETTHSEKVIENTVSRTARVFGITYDGENNVRVLLALAYRTRFGDQALDRLEVTCKHSAISSTGVTICTRHIE